MSKKWVLKTGIVILALLLVIALFIVIIDPLMFYHQPLFDYGYTIKDDIYQNPGIAKNFDYDSVLVGSSMTQNFSTNMINALFDVTSVKLCYSGAYAKTIHEILNIAFDHRDIKKVFWGVDTYALTTDYKFQKYELPEYLYDKNPFNDVKYIYNKTLIFSALKTVYKIAKKEPNTTLDDAYSWYEQYKGRFKPLFEVIAPQNETPGLSQGTIYNEIVRDNLNYNILPFIKAYPDTTFYFFFVPNSVRVIEDKDADGTLEGIISAQKIAVETLLQYNNVEIYYFQNIESIILNPEKYLDESHYSADINAYILESIAQGRHRLTLDNYSDEINKLQKIADTIDVRLLEEQ